MLRLLFTASLLFSATASAEDWPWWRGPTRDGVANPKQKPPTKWSETSNVVWQANVPGRGHGSPTVVGDHVYLATADEKAQTQSVLCFRRDTGKQVWIREIHKGGFARGGNDRSSHASSTVACDGKRLFINFLNGGFIQTTALGLDGERLWQTKVSPYILHQGFGSSPAVYRSLVIVSADNKGGGIIAGLDRETGKVPWKHSRPKLPNYASPIILKIAGKEVLLLTGCDLVTALDPLTGKVSWEARGSTEECVTSIVTDGKHVFTSGGYPKNHISSFLADGSGKLAWTKGDRVYVPSMLVKEGHLYAVLDAGVVACWACSSGKEQWRGRLGGTFSASPVLVGDRIFATNETGRTYIFKATPDKFVLLESNQLGKACMATPAICGGRIYIRVATTDKGLRQETLYCLGSKD